MQENKGSTNKFQSNGKPGANDNKNKLVPNAHLSTTTIKIFKSIIKTGDSKKPHKIKKKFETKVKEAKEERKSLFVNEDNNLSQPDFGSIQYVINRAHSDIRALFNHNNVLKLKATVDGLQLTLTGQILVELIPLKSRYSSGMKDVIVGKNKDGSDSKIKLFYHQATLTYQRYEYRVWKLRRGGKVLMSKTIDDL